MLEDARYARHLALPEVGHEGQARLGESKVLIVGCGGLGSPVALYLAAAGVGTLGIVDFDTVDLSNLQRQIIHTSDDVGHKKIESARRKLQALNPQLTFIGHDERLMAHNVLAIIQDYDLVVDASDNFQTRYLINDACVMRRKAYVYGSVYRFEGLVSFFAPHLGGPCYRCLYPLLPDVSLKNCAEGGVLGVLCGIIGSLQANEAIKYLLRKGRLLNGSLIKFDSLAMDYREIRFAKDPNCKACGTDKAHFKLVDIDNHCFKETPMTDDISVEKLSQLKKDKKDLMILDVRTPDEYAVCHIEGATLVPIQELAGRLSEVPKDKLVVVHCHHGGRSKRAVAFLKTQGYEDVKNLDGGIDQWSIAIDPTVPRY